MKLFLDFFPLLGFFIGYYVFDIYVATGILMVGAFVQTFGHYLMKRSFEKMHVITLLLALVFGGLTLFLRDDSFIKWKVSIFMWMITVVFLARQLFAKRNTLKDLLEGVSGESFGVKDSLWNKLNVAWAITALIVGLVNLYVAYEYSQEVWVNFKVWGIMIIQLLLMVVTFSVLFKHMPEEKKQAMESKNSEPESTNDNTSETKQDA